MWHASRWLRVGSHQNCLGIALYGIVSLLYENEFDSVQNVPLLGQTLRVADQSLYRLMGQNSALNVVPQDTSLHPLFISTNPLSSSHPELPRFPPPFMPPSPPGSNASSSADTFSRRSPTCAARDESSSLNSRANPISNDRGGRKCFRPLIDMGIIFVWQNVDDAVCQR